MEGVDSVCVCVWCVFVLLVDLFQDDLRILFKPHQVNHGGVQKAPSQVSLYKFHTTEEPHQRVCVVGHLLDLHVRLKLVFPFDRDHFEIHGCGTHTQEFVLITTMLDLSIQVFHFSLSRLYVKTFQVH